MLAGIHLNFLKEFRDEPENYWSKWGKVTKGTADTTLNHKDFEDLRTVRNFYFHTRQTSGIKSKDEDHHRGHSGFTDVVKNGAYKQETG